MGEGGGTHELSSNAHTKCSYQMLITIVHYSRYNTDYTAELI